MTTMTDTRQSIEQILVKQIRDEIVQLRSWALQSRSGGWSTHQVDPMRRRAEDLEGLLHSLGFKLQP